MSHSGNDRRITTRPWDGSRTTTTAGCGLLHRPRPGQPPPLRGAPRLLRRRPDLRAGRRAGSGTPAGRWSTWSATTAPGSWTCSPPPRKPGPPPGTARPRTAPATGSIELRRQGLSTYEISARLSAEGTPLNRTSVGEILTEEGFGRLLRHPEPEASINPATPGRDTNLPGRPVSTSPPGRPGWTPEWPGCCSAVPDLVALDLPALAAAPATPAPGSSPPVSWLLSLLALKLTGTRRVSHVDDLLADPAAALFAGLAVLPKKTALTDYSYRCPTTTSGGSCPPWTPR